VRPNEAGNETYEGSWFEDKMHGYGVYHYTSGAIYSGEWEVWLSYNKNY
jgi:hypothetical protein